MGQNSKIEWTDHTFNPWWGCTKVSAACKHCYAETWANRMGEHVWGGKAPRRFLSDNHWKEPFKWDRAAKRSNERRRVFCASMADVFEPRRELDAVRARLWTVIEQTQNLDWLLLTKRPERITEMVPWTTSWPANVWLGCTAETQHWVDKRLPNLLANPAQIHFVSCEPLLGPLDLTDWFTNRIEKGIDWVIAGGESGRGARPMHPSWAVSLRDQCTRAEIPFHFKQWGHWAPSYLDQSYGKGRMTKTVTDERGERVTLIHLPKNAAGRELNGEVWDQFPAHSPTV